MACPVGGLTIRMLGPSTAVGGALASHDGGAMARLRCRRATAADARLAPLQAFKPGRGVTARVTGARPMDGLAICTLKPSAVEGGALSYEDIAPGQLMSGTVDGIEDFGVFVKLAVGVKCASASLPFEGCPMR